MAVVGRYGICMEGGWNIDGSNKGQEQRLREW